VSPHPGLREVIAATPVPRPQGFRP
jgi:hypothetical protein